MCVPCVSDHYVRMYTSTCFLLKSHTYVTRTWYVYIYLYVCVYALTYIYTTNYVCVCMYICIYA